MGHLSSKMAQESTKFTLKGTESLLFMLPIVLTLLFAYEAEETQVPLVEITEVPSVPGVPSVPSVPQPPVDQSYNYQPPPELDTRTWGRIEDMSKPFNGYIDRTSSVKVFGKWKKCHPTIPAGNWCRTGDYKCSGNGFVQCDHNRWVKMDCGPGTLCRPDRWVKIVCDWPYNVKCPK